MAADDSKTTSKDARDDAGAAGRKLDRQLVGGRNSLVTRIALLMVPTAALPLVVFGYYAVSSNFESVREEARLHSDSLTGAMVELLDADLKGIGDYAAKFLTTAPAGSDGAAAVDWVRSVVAGSGGRVGYAAIIGADLRLDRPLASWPKPPENAPKAALYFDTELKRPHFDATSVRHLLVGYKDTNAIYPVVVAKLAGTTTPEAERYLMLVADIASWQAFARARSEAVPGAVAGLVPTDSQLAGLEIFNSGDAELADTAATVLNANCKRADGQPTEGYFVSCRQSEFVDARVVFGQPIEPRYRRAHQLLYAYGAVIATLGALILGILAVLARGIAYPLRRLRQAARELADGRLDTRAPEGGFEEVDDVTRTFNEMVTALQVTNMRMRGTYRSVMELFGATDVDSLMRKTVELACTQCQAEVAWFEPSRVASSVAYGDEIVHLGVRGWVWKNHRAVELAAGAAEAVWKRMDDDRLFAFLYKAQGREIGMVRVAYRAAPDEHTESLLHTLSALAEMAIHRLEQCRRQARVLAEIEVAQMLHRRAQVPAAAPGIAPVAWHFAPATRLGGDWFSIFPDAATGQLHAVLGDVAGKGVAQGLVTTAARGALETLRRAAAEGSPLPKGPAGIVGVLDAVVRAVAEPSELGMTCLAVTVDPAQGKVRICNAGSTFPLLVRPSDGQYKVEMLHALQQPMICEPDGPTGADQAAPAAPVRWEEATYDVKPGDFLVLYSDGLSEMRNFKSGIFGRMLQRGLRRPAPFPGPDAVRDEILGMFRFYTQDAKVEDDVCFVVIEVPAQALAVKGAA
jgi:serine phosphatase RsbU (regulator of sigma subunit)/HAMP domain-containing protein